MRKQLLAVCGALALAFAGVLGVATVATAAPVSAHIGTVTLSRADGTVLRATLNTGANGVEYAVDPTLSHSATPLAGMPGGTVAAVTPLAEGCDSGYICLYQNSNASGARLEVASGYGLSDLRQWPCGGCNSGNNWNDVMSSWRNNSRATGCWYWDISYRGEKHAMYTGNYVQNVLPRENDKASSVTTWGC